MRPSRFLIRHAREACGQARRLNAILCAAAIGMDWKNGGQPSTLGEACIELGDAIQFVKVSREARSWSWSCQSKKVWGIQCGAVTFPYHACVIHTPVCLSPIRGHSLLLSPRPPMQRLFMLTKTVDCLMEDDCGTLVSLEVSLGDYFWLQARDSTLESHGICMWCRAPGFSNSTSSPSSFI